MHYRRFCELLRQMGISQGSIAGVGTMVNMPNADLFRFSH